MAALGLASCCLVGPQVAPVSPDIESCGSAWAAQVVPAPDQTQACGRFWLHVAYGSDDPAEFDFDPRPGHAEELSVTAEELRAMAAHVRAARPADAGPTHWASRAAEYLEAAADHRFRLGQDENLLSFEPLLQTVLQGRPLTAQDLEPAPGLAWDAVVRWRLAAAVRARHGAPLGHPDLERFFYVPGAVPGTDLLPLPRRPEAAADLTDVDRENLALLGG